MSNLNTKLPAPPETTMNARILKKDLNVKLVCKECRNPVPNIVEEYSSGDMVCGDCGLVLGDRIIDTRSEWRTFANDDGADPSRVGAVANPLLDGSQLDTIISTVDNGNGTARELNRIYTKSGVGRSDKHLLQAYLEISSMCESIGLTKLIADIAKQLYKKTDDEKTLRGKSSESIIAACIFIACRQEKVPRTFREICALTKVPKKEIGRCFKILSRSLDHSNNLLGTSGKDLMSRFCSNLNLTMAVQRESEELSKKAKDIDSLAGKSPVSIAAACIYLVSHLYGTPKSAKDIAAIAGVSEGTLRNAYKLLYRAKETIINLEKAKIELTFDSLPSP